MALSDEYSLDLSCGLFMKVSNEGMNVSSESLVALGQRHIALSLDVYDGHDEPIRPTWACPLRTITLLKEGLDI
jgi:hypothetical protein